LDDLKARKITASVLIVVLFLGVWWTVSLKPLLELFSSFRSSHKATNKSILIESELPAFNVRSAESAQFPWQSFFVRHFGQIILKFKMLDEKRKATKSQLVIFVGILKIIITFYQVLLFLIPCLI
jgi:hypothetical protein